MSKDNQWCNNYCNNEICIRCNNKVVKNKTLCSYHLKYVNDGNRRRCKKRIDDGICTRCGHLATSNNKKTCTICRSKLRKWYDTSDKKQRQKQEKKLQRKHVIHHYGGKCVCCGESEITFLAIDHINNNGKEHRKELKKFSNNINKWLIQHGFPKEFQILCHNCNMSKYLNGGICAHKTQLIGV